MKFNKVNLSAMKLDESTHVAKSYTTLVQNNKPQEVHISTDACRKSVRVLSRLNKVKKYKKMG